MEKERVKAAASLFSGPELDWRVTRVGRWCLFFCPVPRSSRMAASLASSSRISAGCLNQLCSVAESCYLGESAIRAALLRAGNKTPARSTVAVGKQREVRRFSAAATQGSAWAAGQDVDSTGTSATSSSARRSALPSAERSVTVGALAELKSRREPM